jgi:segregation and condensation protein A
VSFRVAGYQTDGYRIETDVYQGPLDLLLELIERAELDITHLALAQVTDQYLVYMHRLKLENPAEVSAFLIIATKLLLIKSNALLPKQTLNLDPEEEDPGEALARQLILYKKFKDVASWIGERESEGYKSYLRIASPPKIHVQPKLDLSGVTLEDLIIAAKEILLGRPPLPDLSAVVNLSRITIRDKINFILEDIRKKGNTSFRKILSRRTSRVEIVVTFLALLELVKQHIITAQQTVLFGDIDLNSCGELGSNLEVEIEFEE